MTTAFHFIGQAVVEAQCLELALTPIYQFHRFHTVSGEVEKHDGRMPDGAWKQPLMNLVKELEKNDAIDGAFSQRLRVYLDKRHTLVHRWVLKFGWPMHDAPSTEFDAVIVLAKEVAQESQDLRTMFTKYFVAWADPVWARANPNEYALRMKELFRKVHLPDSEIDEAIKRAQANNSLSSEVGVAVKQIPSARLVQRQ